MQARKLNHSTKANLFCKLKTLAGIIQCHAKSSENADSTMKTKVLMSNFATNCQWHF